MCEIRRGADGQNALPNIVDEEVGLGSPAETKGRPVKQSKGHISINILRQAYPCLV